MAFLFHFWCMKICFNGEFLPADAPVLTAQNRCFKWGDGVFETMKFYQRRLLLASAHFERLFVSLQLLQIDTTPIVSKENLLRCITDLCLHNNCSELARIRLAVFRNDANGAEFVIEAIPLLNNSNEWQTEGLTLCLYPYARKAMDAFANLKSANFLPYVLAQKYAVDHQFEDAVVLNVQSLLCDTSKANIFLVKNQKLYTPALHQGCVNGVMRRTIIDELKKAGITVSQNELSEVDLLEAEEVFLTNAIQTIRWVSSYKNKSYGCTFTRQLFERISATIFQPVV